MKCSKCANDATTVVESAIFKGLKWGYCGGHKPAPKGFVPRARGALGDTGRRPGQWDDTAKSMGVPCIVPGPDGKPRKATWVLEDWHVEDMVYPKHTALVMASGCDFLPWMKRAAASHDFTVCEFSFESLGWNRDPVLRTVQGPSLFHEADRPGMGAVRALKPNAKSKVERLEPDEMFNGIRTAREVRTQVVEANIGFGTHDAPVAGGNVIAARALDGKLRFIVGELGLYSTWHLEAFGAKLEVTQAQYEVAALAQRAAKAGYDPEQYLLWKNAKARIRKLLLDSSSAEKEWGTATPKKRVFFVPQWAYHIDMQMLYVGYGRIALHSFSKQLELVKTLYLKASAERTRLITAITKLQEDYGPVVQRVKELLEKHGFKVLEVAGSFPLQVKDGHRVDSAADKRLYFNFLNGLALFPNKVMVLHNTALEDQLTSLAYELFVEQLEAEGLEVVPLGSHLSMGSGARPHRFDSNDFMYRQEGGLRCKTTTLPISYVPRLQNVAQKLRQLAEEREREERERRERQRREQEREKNAELENVISDLKLQGLWYEGIKESLVATLVRQKYTKALFSTLASLKQEDAPAEIMNEALSSLMD